MIKIRKYSEKQLRSFRFSRLGAYYLNSFNMISENPEAVFELEKTEKIMKERLLEENIEFLNEMEIQKIQFVKSENYENVREKSNLIKRFYENVLYEMVK